jgi:hypothetical protein
VCRGAAFLEAKLCERLLTDGYRIYYLEKLATGGARNIARLTNHPRFNFIYDVLKPFAARIVDPTGSRSRLVYRRLLHNDSPWRSAYIRLARTQLEWEPGVALDGRLAKTIAYFKRLLIRRAPEIEIMPARATVALSKIVKGLP